MEVLPVLSFRFSFLIPHRPLETSLNAASLHDLISEVTADSSLLFQALLLPTFNNMLYRVYFSHFKTLSYPILKLNDEALLYFSTDINISMANILPLI